MSRDYNPWSNPLYRIASGGRGPACPGDIRGWLFGRGAAAIAWRLLPASVVATCVGISHRASLSPARGALAQAVILLGVPTGFALVVALIAAISTARAWQQGRMDEWRVTPMSRAAVVSGLTWGTALPAIAALAAGSIPAAALWAAWHPPEWKAPLFTPLEALLVLIEACAMLYLAAQLGQWAGHRVRRVWSAAYLALAVGVPLLAALAGVVLLSIDLSRGGGHLVVFGAAWLMGNLFGAASERTLQ